MHFHCSCGKFTVDDVTTTYSALQIDTIPDRPRSVEIARRPDQACGVSRGLRRGEPGYLRASLALLAAGLASFNALLHSGPDADADREPAASPLRRADRQRRHRVLAVSILPASVLSERFGRGRVIVASALAATLLGLLLPLAPGLGWLVAGRALQGCWSRACLPPRWPGSPRRFIPAICPGRWDCMWRAIPSVGCWDA